MTPEQQNRAIAEWCGYKQILFHGRDGENFSENFQEWRWYKNDLWMTEGIPDYLNDLNAMHEAENLLTEYQQKTYWCHISTTSTWTVCHADARKRAEALLKTIGKWKD